MKELFNWVLGLFKKPEPEITFEVEAPWPFPAPKAKRRPQVKKATTRAKKPAAKKTTTVAKKASVKASPLLKVMKQEQKEVKKILKQKAK